MQLSVKLLLSIMAAFIILDQVKYSKAMAIPETRHESGATGAQTSTASAERRSVRHIVRTKRETNDSPLDFITSHMPCDMDMRNRGRLMRNLPNHCIWTYNNRYASEKLFRMYKSYQLEAFFFGQYYERFKRFEIDPHIYDYDVEHD
ncbi:uncharacterized protein LOC115620796 [Scaptodrosophila lebanonensis]|uniref:Uncharacterized protein LOC115620796 n=1 Tax=Drosophila lebanonensis TaxID=7225 RepID=A0A6J2T480_DROLE|nr:uncharacterized protein LOC115620796 [Scaptodrosophila lebanonensis]